MRINSFNINTSDMSTGRTVEQFTIVGEEKVAFRFTTDKNGGILDVNELPANLVKPLGE